VLENENDETLRETQRLYENKIKTAQQEIVQMRRQWRREQERLLKTSTTGAVSGGGMRLDQSQEMVSGDPPASPVVSQPSDLLEELQRMKDEHKRLRLLLEEDDAKQKQQLKMLSQQVCVLPLFLLAAVVSLSAASVASAAVSSTSVGGVLQEKSTRLTETNQRIRSKEYSTPAIFFCSSASSEVCPRFRRERELHADPFCRQWQQQW
jgi:hypothetical protein